MPPRRSGRINGDIQTPNPQKENHTLIPVPPENIRLFDEEKQELDRKKKELMQREESLAKRERQLERMAEEQTNEDEIEEEEEESFKKRSVRANQVKTKKKK